jgi:hypothetical protein
MTYRSDLKVFAQDLFAVSCSSAMIQMFDDFHRERLLNLENEWFVREIGEAVAVERRIFAARLGQSA